LYCTFTMSVAITNKFYTFHYWTLTNSSTESILHINKYYMHNQNRPKIPEKIDFRERERERINTTGSTLHAVMLAALSFQQPPLFSRHSFVCMSKVT
jgi:hypothetical protein